MARGVANLGQRAAASQCVTDKGETAVMDGQPFQSSDAKDLAGGAESLAERVT